MKVSLLFENGKYFQADSFGASTTIVGEAVFNTSITGYQEIITDPSYAGQFVIFTSAEIGIVGINEEDMEGSEIFSCGAIVQNYNSFVSNFRSEGTLEDLLKKNNKIGIHNIDTRAIVKMLRTDGNMMCIASSEIHDKAELEKMLKSEKHIDDINYVEKVSTKKEYTHSQGVWIEKEFKYNNDINNHKNIAILDFGIKKNILNELYSAGFNIKVYPFDTKADVLIKLYEDNQISGIFLSNGPGNPLNLKEEISQIKILAEKNIPICGICLGHQLLSIANGYDVYRLKFGHHGGNHPVKNEDGKVEITAQNHNYNVPEEIAQICDVIATNLFDNTIEGVKYKNHPFISVQHHPESSPGPMDSKNVFKQFYDLMDNA